jgi:hypothetical protein
VPYDLRCTVSMSMGRLGFYGGVEKASLYLDGQFIVTVPNPFGPHDYFWTWDTLKCDQPGLHKLRAVFHVVFYERESGADGQDVSRYSLDAAFESQFEVLPASAVTLRAMPNTSLRDRLRAVIEIKTLRYRNGVLGGELSMTQPPTSVAFDLIARVNGTEYVAGKMAVSQSSPIWRDSLPRLDSFLEAKCPHPQTGKCDIILRPNPDRATETLDVYEFWAGELEFKDVPIEVKN